jgi:hypothetical protein
MDTTLMESRQLDAMFDSIVAQRMALNHYSGIEYVGGDDSNVNPSAARYEQCE